MNPAVLFHTHGLGPFDFSNIIPRDLHALDSLAAERHALICPTVYLLEHRLNDFEALLRSCARLKQAGQLERILGWAIEGPVLGPRGGIPKGTVWNPSKEQWHQIVGWFAIGLRYVVIAPDMMHLNDEIDRGFTFANLLELIYRAGGRVALGHFDGASDVASAQRLDEVLAHIEASFVPSPYLVLTDHLFNDMPRSFTHAFRTSTELTMRDAEIAKHTSHSWEASSLANLLGPVPSAILLAARAARLTPSLNFDGAHVDLAICRRVVEFLGASRVIAITDHTETSTLAGEPLLKDELTGLLYRDDGVLAASSLSHEDQRRNMRSIGMTADDIRAVQFQTPLAALQYQPCPKSTAHLLT